MIKYQCFICKRTVWGEQAEAPLDPCAVVLVAKFDRPRGEQKEQQLFCHFECFRQVVNDDGIMHIMESDFATLAETAEDDEQLH